MSDQNASNLEAMARETVEAERRVAEMKAELTELTTRINASLAQALATPLDHQTFTGAPDVPPGLPHVVQGTIVGHAEAPRPSRPTLQQAEARSEVTHSATPAMRRAAWLAHHARLVEVQERQLTVARSQLRFVPLSGQSQAPFLAEEWAALQLLKVLRDMKAPEVPVDDTVGQATLEEALAQPERKVHWQGEDRTTLHSWSKSGPRPTFSGDEEEVTCKRCLHLLHLLAKRKGDA